MLNLPALALSEHHIIIARLEHLTRLADLPAEQWLKLQRWAYQISRYVESVPEVVRVYIASLGSARDDLFATTPHIHIHVVGVLDASLRPRQVLTWQRGVLCYSPEELRERRNLWRKRLPGLATGPVA